MFDDLAERLDWPEQARETMWQKLKEIPVVSTERVNSLSELLCWTAAGLSDHTFARLEEKRQSGELQAELWEQISFLKNYAYVDRHCSIIQWPKKNSCWSGSKLATKLGEANPQRDSGPYLFLQQWQHRSHAGPGRRTGRFLSRAAIRGGADTAQIFGLNYTYLGKIYSFRNVDEIAFWLSGIMNRFSEQVFNLSHVKHADVIYRAVDYVRKNYTRKVTLEETAALVYLSPAYFSGFSKMK